MFANATTRPERPLCFVVGLGRDQTGERKRQYLASASGRMGYKRARFLLLAAGLGVLILVAVFQYVRGKDVDPTEMGGTLLFIPVFIAFVFGNVAGGVIAGILAGLGYLGLRYPAI